MRYKPEWGGGSIRSSTQMSATVRQIEIVPDRGIVPYAAGSHLLVGVTVNDVQDHRSYSLVGEAAVKGAYRIAVKQLPNSRGGSRYLWSVPVGGRVEISDPQNLFELSLGRPHYLLIAGGIGITPLIGMAMALLQRGAAFELVYATRRREEMVYLDELKTNLGQRLRLCVSEDGTRADFASIFSALPPEAEVYFCGPLKMLDDAQRAWREGLRSSETFRFETFGSSGRFARETFQVEIRDRCRIVTVPQDQSIIDAIEAAGIPMMYDCMRGECGLCLVDVVQVEGELDHRDVFLSDEQRQAGTQMCVCVSRAIGGRVVIDTGWRPDANDAGGSFD